LDVQSREVLETLFERRGYADYRWIDPKEVVVAQWVRMKCTFGCDSYGRNAACPPNTPTVDQCRCFFDEYEAGVILHFSRAVEQPEDRYDWTREVNKRLLELERAVFMLGYEKAFLLFMDCCRLCAECAGTREACKQPVAARPSPEGMAVDVFSTVRRYGYPIEVLTAYDQPMNRYAFLLIQ
jgi:predicted metal-binding protein